MRFLSGYVATTECIEVEVVGKDLEFPIPQVSMKWPVCGSTLPQRGNAVSRWLGRAVLRAMGWRFEGALPNVPRLVVIVAPHTSNWDFVIGYATVLALGLDARFLGKHTLFRPPLGWLMRYLGGIPVNRSSPAGVVTQVIERFDQEERFLLGLSPEGTRKHVERWRMGFYHIAVGAGIPILPAYFDYAHKVVGVGELCIPTGHLEADVQALRAFYTPFQGKYPELSFTHEHRNVIPFL